MLRVIWGDALQGIDFGTAWREIGGGKGKEYQQHLAPRESIMLVVEEYAGADVQQYADHYAHDDFLQHWVGRQQE